MHQSVRTKFSNTGSNDRDRAIVLSKATIRAADLLGISQAMLAAILGISSPSSSRLWHGKYFLTENTKTWELACLFVKIYQLLNEMVGGNANTAKQWLNNHNQALMDRPLRLLSDIQGLTRVYQYLDFYCNHR